MNARDYLTSGSFIKKAELRASGPQRLTIKAVETAEGLPGRDGKPAVQELQLVFTDDRRTPLRAQVNLRRMLEGFGDDTATWIGQVIELYFNPDVTNPSGGEPGGIRLRVPETAPRTGTFRSDLEEAAPVSRKARTRAGAKVAEDDIAF